MIEQLTQSMNFDCGSDYYEQKLIEIKNLTYKKHIKDVQAANKWAIKYHTEQLKKEDDNIDKANQWITDLYKSLEN